MKQLTVKSQLNGTSIFPIRFYGTHPEINISSRECHLLFRVTACVCGSAADWETGWPRRPFRSPVSRTRSSDKQLQMPSVIPAAYVSSTAHQNLRWNTPLHTHEVADYITQRHLRIPVNIIDWHRIHALPLSRKESRFFFAEMYMLASCYIQVLLLRLN